MPTTELDNSITISLCLQLKQSPTSNRAKLLSFINQENRHESPKNLLSTFLKETQLQVTPLGTVTGYNQTKLGQG